MLEEFRPIALSSVSIGWDGPTCVPLCPADHEVTGDEQVMGRPVENPHAQWYRVMAELYNPEALLVGQLETVDIVPDFWCPEAGGPSPPRVASMTFLHQAPAVTRRWHHAVRGATPYEVDVVMRRLESETDALSTGKIIKLIRWLTGREITRDTSELDDPWQQVLRWLRAATAAASTPGTYPALRTIGPHGLVDTLRRALWRRRRALRTRLIAPLLISPCTAHASELLSAITRHGPPQSSTHTRPLPGVSVCG